MKKFKNFGYKQETMTSGTTKQGASFNALDMTISKKNT